MTRMMITLAATAAAAAGFAALPAPAAAQQAQDNEVIVYGNDPCPRSTDSTVYVCTRRPENQRYRIPETLRESGTRQQRQSWATKSRQIMSAGATGINSCSAVGPGGSTGCLVQSIQQAKRESQEAAQQGTAPEQ
jgi:nitrogenase subunit NifH